MLLCIPSLAVDIAQLRRTGRRFSVDWRAAHAEALRSVVKLAGRVGDMG